LQGEVSGSGPEFKAIQQKKAKFILIVPSSIPTPSAGKLPVEFF
jgi:hypothetical protein